MCMKIEEMEAKDGPASASRSESGHEQQKQVGARLDALLQRLQRLIANQAQVGAMLAEAKAAEPESFERGGWRKLPRCRAPVNATAAGRRGVLPYLPAATPWRASWRTRTAPQGRPAQ
jgi:hypothetical protein